jgi:hypothetical protein
VFSFFLWVKSSFCKCDLSVPSSDPFSDGFKPKHVVVILVVTINRNCTGSFTNADSLLVTLEWRKKEQMIARRLSANHLQYHGGELYDKAAITVHYNLSCLFEQRLMVAIRLPDQLHSRSKKEKWETQIERRKIHFSFLPGRSPPLVNSLCVWGMDLCAGSHGKMMG